MKRNAFRLTGYMLVLTAGLITAACSPTAAPGGGAVQEAYNSSGVVHVSPYNRSIFNTGNF